MSLSLSGAGTAGRDRDTAYELGVSMGLALTVALLWELRHQYVGLRYDAQLYALQALARLHPGLANDLALQGGSQDHYTIFAPIYAWFVARLDIRTAALALWILWTCGFLVAAWYTVRNFATREMAFACVAVLGLTVGSYGAAAVFRYDENYFTARIVAEALILAAIAIHQSVRGALRRAESRVLAIAIAMGAILIHPLMALPGFLMLLCLTVPTRVAVQAALAGVAGTLCFALVPVLLPGVYRFIKIMDPAWLEVVRERSQFLFLSYWSVGDWELNARPFLSLAVTLAVLEDPRARKLGIAAVLVGAAGLVVALIAGTVGPVAILVQGQAWRWVWITTLFSVLLIVPTAVRLWREASCGPVCALLLVAAWTLSPGGGVTCLAGIALLWLLRAPLSHTVVGRWPPWTSFQPRIPRVVFNLPVLGVLRAARSRAAPGILGCLVATLPASVSQGYRLGSPEEIQEFAGWRRVIPPGSTVYVPSAKDSGGFTWLTLGRPAYLSTDQSAGVVFSRDTAIEVVRRSETLLPVEDPDWKIMTRLSSPADENGRRSYPKSRPLTAQSLEQICRDPLLGFVVAAQNVGFEPLRHMQAGIWHDWNLYDCDRVRGW